jgi:hypothetical protein
MNAENDPEEDPKKDPAKKAPPLPLPHTFGSTPPARADGRPWTQAEIDQWLREQGLPKQGG